MKVKAKELKKGDRIIVGAEELEIEEIEISDISKQGTKKTRIVAKKSNGDKIVIIRPEDYPIDKK